jgi:outer membrane receptor for ferrienterochelin and colicins
MCCLLSQAVVCGAAAQVAVEPGPAPAIAAQPPPADAVPSLPASSQSPSAAEPPSPPAAAPQTPPATAPPAGAASPSPPSPGVQQIQITGGRESEADQRRQSTASKIIIGRDEIDRYGDSTLGEVLRRLPGVTTPGAPGRGGPPRLRGLGSGYTQLLIDGQRLPPGFSLESLTPEQVERIEILRAPTAETGARAIAGTINIVLREALKRRSSDLRLSVGAEGGEVSPSLNWNHNDSDGPLTYSVSGGLFDSHRRSESLTETRIEDLSSGSLRSDRSEAGRSESQRLGLNLSSRLQWRLGEAGDTLVLSPSLFASRSETHSTAVLTERGSDAPLYDTAESDTDGRNASGRLNAQWRRQLGPARLDANATGGATHNRSHTERTERGGAAGLRRTDDRRETRERTALASAKLSGLAGGAVDVPGSEHNLVGGFELETARRTETRSVLGSGAIDDGDGGDELEASSLRLAAYGQDEWQLSPQWSVSAGLRWEGIRTRGQAEDGSRPDNRSSVWTPLLHALWKPDPKGRDQLRLSLTRSYRSPGLGSLIAQRSINTRFPADGANEPLSPDRVGNPDLRPELATGIDVAIERWPVGGGVLSANLFHRRIDDLIRSVTTLQAVPWSPVPRWVAQDANIGDATAQGLELEAKFRLDQWLDDAPRVDLRGNLSLYRSDVAGVPGPDNRLDQQAPRVANLGADYRLRGLPLLVGGTLNWVAGYRTQLSAEQSVTTGSKSVFDAYALWTLSPDVALRLTSGNLSARDYANGSQADNVDSAGRATRETVSSIGPSWINWQVRVELKL